MRKSYPILVVLCLLLLWDTASAQTTLWTESAPTYRQGNLERDVSSDRIRIHQLNLRDLKNVLENAPESRANASSNRTVIQLPTPDGQFRSFAVFKSNIMHPDLAAKYPNIRTYAGQGIDDPTSTVRFDVTPRGFHALIFDTNGTVYIDPQRRDSDQSYVTYFKRDYLPEDPKEFVEHEPLEDGAVTGQGPVTNAISDGNMRTYRAAISCTGEYAQFHGGTVELALAAIVTTMNRVTGIYERDLAVSFQLVANNDQIIYTNGATDPYNNNSAFTLISQSQSNIDAVIGNSNYDIGHTFSTGAGGLASLAVVCSNSSKARGVTGTNNPIGDPYDVDYVSHEIGHQFGGNHTFNGSTGSCSGGNRNGSTAYEPGSGTTIQAYAGICGAQNIQNNSDDYFHGISLDEMISHINGSANSCAVITPISGSIPTVDAGSNYTIPASTPFALTGSASDADGDALTYCWEQFDLGPQGPPDLATSTSAPIFRSFSPVTSPTRTFPQISDIVNNTQTIGEILPSVSRNLTFRLTVRDNRAGGGSVNDDEVEITVENTGAPFAVTSPNTSVTWSSGSNQTVTWNVSGTNAAPISAAEVDILLSTDGGFTYSTVLASNVPNDGSELITVPAIATTTARIRVEASDNIFFDISNTNFTIENTGPCTVTVPTGLNATGISSSGATLNWATVSGATSYDYRYRETGTTTWTEATTNATSVPVTGLSPETEYEFQVRAECPDDISAYSASVLFTTLEIPPPCTVDTPTGLAVNGVTDSGASASWNSVTDATGYNYRYKPTASTTWIEASTTSTSVSLNGLSPETEYEIQVNAFCPDETSPFSGSVVFTTDEESTLQPCNIAPQNLSADVSTTTALITWDEVENVNFYQYRWRVFGTSNWNGGTATTNSLNLTGLSPSTTYELNIRSSCSTGNSPVASFSWITEDEGGDPCADVPDGLTAGSITETSATISWNGTSEAISYNYRYRETGSATWTTNNTASTNANLTGLSEGTTYEFQVEAVCSTETSGYSASSQFTTTSEADPCDVPTGLSSSSITTSGATISWSSVAAALSYEYRFRPVGSGSWVNGSTGSTSANLTGLSEDTDYEFQVSSVCAEGSSAFSPSSFFTTDTSGGGTTPCNQAPQNFVFDVTGTTANISWSPVEGAQLYQYRYRSTGAWTNGTTASNSLSLTGLSPNTTYTLMIRTFCGSFSPLATVNFTTASGSAARINTGSATAYLQAGSLMTYPNPVKTRLYLSIPEVSEKASIVIYNLTGSVVYQEKLNSAQIEINTMEFKSGLYLVKIVDGSNIMQAKFLKE